MRFYLVATFVVLSSVLAFGNDTLVQKTVGGNEYALGASNSIEIRSEILTFDLYKDSFVANVKYEFWNDGSDQQLSVGFPDFEYLRFSNDLAEPKRIHDFTSLVDDKLVNTKEEPASIKLSENEAVKRFFVKTVIFPGKKVTRIENSYKATYQQADGQQFVEYLLGTAKSWKALRSLKVVINLRSPDVFLDYRPSLESVPGGKVQAAHPAEGVVAYKEDVRTLSLDYGEVALNANTRYVVHLENAADGIFGLPWDYNFETMVYSRDDFELLTNEQLRKARNLIFAWHGYRFKDPVLQAFFDNSGWYKDKKKLIFSESTFNEKERRNLQLIESVESGRDKT